MTQTAITPRPEITALAHAGQVANDIAARSVFMDYQSRKAKNTLRRHANDLALFADFLRVIGLQIGEFSNDPEAWRATAESTAEIIGMTREEINAKHDDKDTTLLNVVYAGTVFIPDNGRENSN